MIAKPPPVTCVMPTSNRRRYVPHAVDCFLRQDYPDLELLVVDDGADEVADLMPADRRVRYVRLPCRQQIGAKRNTACDLAAGAVIVHWDDDDWSADNRVSEQVTALVASGADLCGQSRVLFYEPVANRAWEYRYPADARPWVHGATLCYTKAFWRRNPFPDIRLGEDTRFVWAGRPQQVIALDDRRLYVGTIHGANTSPKQLADRRWHACAVADVQTVVGDAWCAYRRAVGGQRNVEHES
jgi:glycosyltransferase involved in cell wall biosynthesis